MHGGLSTGPKTAEGKAKALRVMRDGWLRWRQNFVAPLRRYNAKSDRLQSESAVIET